MKTSILFGIGASVLLIGGAAGADVSSYYYLTVPAGQGIVKTDATACAIVGQGTDPVAAMFHQASFQSIGCSTGYGNSYLTVLFPWTHLSSETVIARASGRRHPTYDGCVSFGTYDRQGVPLTRIAEQCVLGTTFIDYNFGTMSVPAHTVPFGQFRALTAPAGTANAPEINNFALNVLRVDRQ